MSIARRILNEIEDKFDREGPRCADCGERMTTEYPLPMKYANREGTYFHPEHIPVDPEEGSEYRQNLKDPAARDQFYGGPYYFDMLAGDEYHAHKNGGLYKYNGMDAEVVKWKRANPHKVLPPGLLSRWLNDKYRGPSYD